MIKVRTSDDGNDAVIIDERLRLVVHYKGGPGDVSVQIVMPEKSIDALYAGITKDVSESDLQPEIRNTLNRAYRWAVNWMQEVADA